MTPASYLLDTDTMVALLRDRSSAVRQRFRQAMADGAVLSISTVTYFELSYGIAKSGQPAVNARRLSVLLSSGIELLPFGQGEAHAAGEIRTELEAAGTPIGSYDVLVAGHARSRGTTLVTGNVREFARVRGLRLKNWLAT